MGFWSIYSPDRLDEAEQRLMDFSGVTFTKIRVEISTGNFLYCLKCGDPSNPPMILLHGYCGSGMIFYKILKALSTKYYIYILDHIGMGRSSRPSFKAISTYETECFFVEGLESFRRAVGLERFFLAGHSFGGYISGCYNIRFPQHVAGLLMLSPGGVAERPLDGDGRSVWESGWINKLLLFLWLKHVSFLEIMRKLGPMSAKVMKSYMNGKFNLPKDEFEAVTDYLSQVNVLPGSGEHGINYILDFEMWPYSPLCKRLHVVKTPIAFFYGDHDWMVSDGGYKTKEMSESLVLVYIISNSDHHVYWDNPVELQEKMHEALELMSNYKH
ncbi:hypothetical protein SteCoe_22486 [Stentor coeruleus]|uniref:AB hydrolase-1 domain-containing protein n=1 Tax=Stentor coeruleus TaxID=5963 RepID=A0A1R2BM69_9CILI|nr:hypothetical protein SteCoe_22486 [Stentor coeruleus]